jgi:WD40 repeat protein
MASEKSTVTIYDTISRSKIAILKGHNAKVTAIAFSPDGRRLATASDDRTAKLWDLTTNRTLLTFSGHNVDLSSVAFSADGTTLVTADRARVVRHWVAPADKTTDTKSGGLFKNENQLAAEDTKPSRRLLLNFDVICSAVDIRSDKRYLKWNILTQTLMSCISC